MRRVIVHIDRVVLEAFAGAEARAVAAALQRDLGSHLAAAVHAAGSTGWSAIASRSDDTAALRIGAAASPGQTARAVAVAVAGAIAAPRVAGARR